MAREWGEEVGGTIRIVKEVRADHRKSPISGEPFIWYVYLVEILELPTVNEVTLAGEQSPQWWPVQNLPENLFPSHRSVICRTFAYVSFNKLFTTGVLVTQ